MLSDRFTLKERREVQVGMEGTDELGDDEWVLAGIVWCWK